MTITRRMTFLLAASVLSGCVSAADPKLADPDPTDTADKAIASCVERVRMSTTPHSMLPLRQVLRVRTDEQAYPILCRKIRRGLADKRLSYDDLSWNDGTRPMSTRLIKVLREP